MNRFFNDFHIGTYYLQENARTERHIRDIKNCGIDLVIGARNDTAMLDLFQKYGIHAVVLGVVPGWFGGSGDNAGTMRQTNPKEAYIRGINKFQDHPAIVGIDAGDEPSALDFPYYGEVIELIKDALPNHFPYLNLYPSYGMLASNEKAQTDRELGVASYGEYMEAYVRHVDLPYLSFDHYVYTSDKNRLFGDLHTAAACCRKTGKKLHVVLQVNSAEEDVFISEAQLCFQAFSALAYGAAAVSWACYSPGWWHNNVLDRDGNKTEQYEKLRRVNHKLRALAAEYIRYQWVDTVRSHGGEAADFDVFRYVWTSRDALIGLFEKAEGEKAIFVSPLDEKAASGNILRFRLAGSKSAYLHTSDSTWELHADPGGVYEAVLHGCEACFITA